MSSIHGINSYGVCSVEYVYLLGLKALRVEDSVFVVEESDRQFHREVGSDVLAWGDLYLEGSGLSNRVGSKIAHVHRLERGCSKSGSLLQGQLLGIIQVAFLPRPYPSQHY